MRKLGEILPADDRSKFPIKLTKLSTNVIIVFEIIITRIVFKRVQNKHTYYT